MKRLNLLPLFLVVTLLLSSLPIHFAQADSTVIYQTLSWTANAFINEVNQADITGVSPTQIANMFYRPQSDTIGMFNSHGFNGSDYGFHYRFFFAIDYSTYAIIASPTVGNTSIFESNSGTNIGHIGYNTSFTHLANNVFLAGIKDFGAGSVTFDAGTSEAGWANLGVSSCQDYTTLTGDIFHEFLIQMKNDTGSSGSYAYELFVDGNFWCTYNVSTGANKPTQARLGNVDDLGTGSGSGNLRARYREYLVTGGRSAESLILAGLAGAPPIEAPPPAFGEGLLSTFSVLLVEDDRGNLRAQYAEGETIIFDASLRFINDTTGLVENVPQGEILNFFRFDEFFSAWTFIGEAQTIDRNNGRGPRARLPYVHIDGLVPTTDFRANYTGNSFVNMSATISNIQRIITIEDAEIPLSIGTRLSPPLIQGTSLGANVIGPILGSDIFPQTIFRHGELFRVSSFLTRIDTGATLSGQRIFLEIDVNATGTWQAFQTLTTNEVGRADSSFRTWDSRFVGEQRFRFRFFASAPFANSTSVNGTAFISTSITDFMLTIELVPSSVRTGDRVEIRGQLLNIGQDGIGIPLSNERIELFASSFDKTSFFKLTASVRTNEGGFYTRVVFGPNLGGLSSATIDFFVNSSVNSVVVTSPNATLTITELVTPPPSEVSELEAPSFILFTSLITTPQANCEFSDGKICSTMLWMLIVFIVSSVLALISAGLKIPPAFVGTGWLFMMLGGMTLGVAVQAVMELMLFIAGLPAVALLILSLRIMIKSSASQGMETA